MQFARLGRLALIAGAAAVLATPTLAQQQMPPKQVGVVELRMQDVPRVVTLPGRAVAGEEAAIRPRVSGMITDILYRAGTPLRAGDPMFRLDATALLHKSHEGFIS
ncbi:MAG: biotin/lipoyl-binding protein [Sphingomonadaceae bacterium]|nr:biotin/lipoyl-binding protein [Sphingomonadaceae bacterium]